MKQKENESCADRLIRKMRKKKNPKQASLKQLGEDLDSINQKLLDKIERQYSFQRALDGISESMNKLTLKKAEIHFALLERKQVSSVRYVSKINRLLKK